MQVDQYLRPLFLIFNCQTPDFFARISFPQKAHFLFGTKGPIRIVGQCKKYANRDNVGHMKEFVTTMNNVYNKSYRAGEILPDWFKLEKGDIIPSLTVGKIKMATNPVNMGSVAVFYFVTICAIL